MAAPVRVERLGTSPNTRKPVAVTNTFSVYLKFVYSPAGAKRWAAIRR